MLDSSRPPASDRQPTAGLLDGESDPEDRIIERERYAVLLHLYTHGLLAEYGGLPCNRIVRDLGFREARADDLVQSLLSGHYVDDNGSVRGLAVTPKGIHYIERGAWRRRSIRL